MDSPQGFDLPLSFRYFRQSKKQSEFKSPLALLPLCLSWLGFVKNAAILHRYPSFVISLLVEQAMAAIGFPSISFWVR